MNASFDIGDLFYIILTVIFILAGTFGKKKKPVQNRRLPDEIVQDTPVQSDSPGISRNIDDLFREYLGTEELSIEEKPAEIRAETEGEVTELPSESEAYTYEEVTEPVYSESSNATDPAYSESFSEERITFKEEYTDERELYNGIYDHFRDDQEAIADQIKESEGMDIDGTDNDAALIEVTENFNARKAFLYSEIFNRKNSA